MAMFIPEAIEGAEALTPLAERFGGTAFRYLKSKVNANTVRKIQEHLVTGHQLLSNFSHHDDENIHRDIHDMVRPFTNKYGSHPTKIQVNHEPVQQSAPQQTQEPVAESGFD